MGSVLIVMPKSDDANHIARMLAERGQISELRLAHIAAQTPCAMAKRLIRVSSCSKERCIIVKIPPVFSFVCICNKKGSLEASFHEPFVIT